MKTYQQPSVGDQVIRDLLPVEEKTPVLKPETPVIIINRGREVIADSRSMFDGQQYHVAPGLSRARYDLALHLRERCIVPGSRNPISGKTESLIGILNVDPPAKCEPFTAEQCDAFGQIAEGLEAGDRQVIPASAVAGRIADLGENAVDLQTQGAAAMDGPLKKVRPEENAALAEMQTDAAGMRTGAADDDGDAAPAPSGRGRGKGGR